MVRREKVEESPSLEDLGTFHRVPSAKSPATAQGLLVVETGACWV
jgi:hypothetical protein